MDIATLILLIAAAIVFALAAFRVVASVKVDLIALGLLLWVLVPLLLHVDTLT